MKRYDRSYTCDGEDGRCLEEIVEAEDGHLYMDHEVDAEIATLRAQLDELRAERDVARARVAAFESAAEYDAERGSPAGDEARHAWGVILDKPHYALPTIQALVTERDAAIRDAAMAEAERNDAIRERDVAVNDVSIARLAMDDIAKQAEGAEAERDAALAKIERVRALEPWEEAFYDEPMIEWKRVLKALEDTP